VRTSDLLAELDARVSQQERLEELAVLKRLAKGAKAAAASWKKTGAVKQPLPKKGAKGAAPKPTLKDTLSRVRDAAKAFQRGAAKMSDKEYQKRYGTRRPRQAPASQPKPRAKKATPAAPKEPNRMVAGRDEAGRFMSAAERQRRQQQATATLKAGKAQKNASMQAALAKLAKQLGSA